MYICITSLITYNGYELSSIKMIYIPCLSHSHVYLYSHGHPASHGHPVAPGESNLQELPDVFGGARLRLRQVPGHLLQREGATCDAIPLEPSGLSVSEADIGYVYWWFSWNMTGLFILLGMSSSQLAFIFFRGVQTTKQYRCVFFWGGYISIGTSQPRIN